MKERPTIDDADLHAFLDGALEPARAGAVEAELQRDPALAARLAGFKADKELLKSVYGPIADRPLPQEWIAQARRRPGVGWRRAGAIAAVLVMAVASLTLYRMKSSPAPSGEIVQAALDARQSTGGQTFAIAKQGATPQWDGLVSATVAMQVKIPSLEKLGYHLDAIRLLPKGQGGRAAELLYRDNAGRLFTLYLRRSDGEARFDQFERAGMRVCIWQDDQLAMVMAGNVSTAAMQRLASLAYTGLKS